MEELAQGARPKTYSLRKGTRQDYERMHEGDAKLKKQLSDVRDMPGKTLKSKTLMKEDNSRPQ